MTTAVAPVASTFVPSNKGHQSKRSKNVLTQKRGQSRRNIGQAIGQSAAEGPMTQEPPSSTLFMGMYDKGLDSSRVGFSPRAMERYS